MYISTLAMPFHETQLDHNFSGTRFILFIEFTYNVQG
jgi:hypothetical protein